VGVKRGKTKGEATNRKTKKVQEKNTLEEHPLNPHITPSSSLPVSCHWDVQKNQLTDEAENTGKK
jgi:hypothetical protein